MGNTSTSFNEDLFVKCHDLSSTYLINLMCELNFQDNMSMTFMKISVKLQLNHFSRYLCTDIKLILLWVYDFNLDRHQSQQ